jgi:hypothetical protein
MKDKRKEVIRGMNSDGNRMEEVKGCAGLS